MEPSLLHPPHLPHELPFSLEYVLFSQSLHQKSGDSAAEVSWTEKRDVIALVTGVLYEIAEDSSLLKSRGNHFTSAEATPSVNPNGLEELLPLPKVSNFLCSASTGLLHHGDTLCLPGNYLEREPALSRGSL